MGFLTYNILETPESKSPQNNNQQKSGVVFEGPRKQKYKNGGPKTNKKTQKFWLQALMEICMRTWAECEALFLCSFGGLPFLCLLLMLFLR